MPEKNRTSSHILNASSNLLGICFVVLTSLKLFSISDKTIIDELTSIATLFFMTACILSFLAIRGSIKHSNKLENLADACFFGGLILLFITALLFSFNIIR